eukprot:TRINITY_DN1150_c0_g1_i1.p1 TRINITY_DN1150_c0_g1~~TRINITY_DN1150_c0_g1_i1.p1  ORF type:complete len:510 (-),score=21.23 TRINITY_DN1150_c0_g1_i1:2908-4437(-)
MMALEEYTCQNHADRIASEDCTLYPCINTHLCEECSALHGFSHGSTDIAALEKSRCSLLLLSQEIDKQLISCSEIESRLRAFSSSRPHLAKMEEIHRMLPHIKDDLDYVMKRLEGERKLLTGCVPHACNNRGGPINYNVRHQELLKEFNELKAQYKSFLYSRFMELMAKDLSNVLIYFDFNECALVMVHAKAHVKITIDLRNFGVKSCKSFTSEGGPCVQRVGNRVYLLGGFDKPETFGDLWVISFNRGQYHVEKLRSMNYPRYSIASTVANGRYIYAVGGTVFENGAEKQTNYVERYDILANKWTDLTFTSTIRANASLSVVDDRFIYLYGGLSENNAPCNTLEVYDMLDEAQGWRTVDQKEEAWGILENCSTAAQLQIGSGKLLVASKTAAHILDVYGSEIVNKKKVELGLKYEINYRPMWMYGRDCYFISSQGNDAKAFDVLKGVTKVFKYYQLEGCQGGYLLTIIQQLILNYSFHTLQGEKCVDNTHQNSQFFSQKKQQYVHQLQ